MDQLNITKVGVIRVDDTGFRIQLDPACTPALAGLEGFGHIQVLWWFSGCDDTRSRAHLQEDSPYKKGPAVLGSFATRSPRRPNPVALSCAGVTYIDAEQGIVGLTYIDAEDGSPVLDIKPYTPSLDRVEQPQVPAWCAHWPGNVETAGDFDWGAEFNF